jgi:purine-binding chemotaxis protein CheW
MNDLFLVLTVSGRRVALPADSVESVVEIDDVAPVPLVTAHVAGLFALRSRVMTVIDTVASLEAGRSDWTGLAQAVIVMCDGHGYALLVDGVEDVVVIENGVSPCRAVLAKGWARVALGEIHVDGEALLALDPAALVSGPVSQAA